MPRRIDPRIAVALLLLVGTCGFAAYRSGVFRTTKPASVTGSGLTRNDSAPEFAGINQWINAHPLTIRSLRGHVVLIDFWTYSCINCLRTVPELRAFYAEYKPFGLEIVGVHSPEFSFEKVAGNVRRAVAENKVLWPVAMDNQMKTWDLYENHYWPHVYVVDGDGNIRYDVIGEGGGAHIETALRTLLRRPGVSLPPPVTDIAELPSDNITPELYLGYERGSQYLGNTAGYAEGKAAPYRLPAAGDQRARPNGAFYLGGRWRATAEYIQAAGSDAQIVVPFTARNVYIVAGSKAPGGSRVRVSLDGAPLKGSQAGVDVKASVLTIKGQDLYRIVHLNGVEIHRLTLSLDGGDPSALSAYTFSFG